MFSYKSLHGFVLRGGSVVTRRCCLPPKVSFITTPNHLFHMSAATSSVPFDRNALEQVLHKRFFFAPAFHIYGGVAGLYDYGPAGCALQANIIQFWRQFFILEEDMLELDTTILTPYDVLKTSGHVDKFADWMVKDMKTGEFFRADHLLEAVLEARLEADTKARQEGDSVETATTTANSKANKTKKKIGALKSQKLEPEIRAEYEMVLAKIDNYSGPELDALIRKFKVTSPETGEELGPVKEFNLMFETSIGPTGQAKGYLRPETAQGQFLNFKKLLEFNNEKMPFASAQIGRSFRNEISPRSGLIRVREFTMAEIEHFVDPLNKSHYKFSDVRSTLIRILPAQVQQAGQTTVQEMSVGEAVDQKIVDNETLGYFLARIQIFLERIGINRQRLRFRQHMHNEMAHYACDCWDAEIHTSYGWIECVGCADRSAYDLTVHAKKTNEKLVVRETLAKPVTFEKWQMEINRKVFGPQLKKAAKTVEEALTALGQEELSALAKKLETGPATLTVGTVGEEHELNKEMLQIRQVSVTEHVREYTPNVIEPSFGLGRILYALMEHVWWVRPGDEQRGVLSFPVSVAPTKCLVLPLSGHESFRPIVHELASRLRQRGIPNRVDDSSASVGRRYARNDELGTPFGLTVDFQTVQDGTVTLRERDTTKQIREKTEVILDVLEGLVKEKTTWSEVLTAYPVFVQQEI